MKMLRRMKVFIVSRCVCWFVGQLTEDTADIIGFYTVLVTLYLCFALFRTRDVPLMTLHNIIIDISKYLHT